MLWSRVQSRGCGAKGTEPGTTYIRYHAEGEKLGAGSNQQTLAAEHDLSLAESALVIAETAYEKARIEVHRATGSILEEYGISIDDAREGKVEEDHPR